MIEEERVVVEMDGAGAEVVHVVCEYPGERPYIALCGRDVTEEGVTTAIEPACPWCRDLASLHERCPDPGPCLVKL